MAFDWIESHRGLRDHPKTVALAAAWSDRKPCVLGHLHELWWWTLEYAPDGLVRSAFFPQVVTACEWHGRPQKFWSGLVEAGFLEAQVGIDGYVVHDWDEYAVRRIQRYEQTAKRKQEWREKSGRPAGRENGASGPSGEMSPDGPAGRPEAPPGRSGGASPTRARHQPDLPTNQPAAAAAASLPASGLADGEFIAAPAREEQPDEVRERLNRPPIPERPGRRNGASSSSSSKNSLNSSTTAC